MPFDLPVWLKTGLGWVWPKIKEWGLDRFARARVSRTAMEGGNFASEGSLPHLVKMELERLTSDPFALPEIRSASFRNWLKSTSNLKPFVSALIAKAGGRDGVAVNAQESLAEKFQEATGESSKLATGWINLAISYIHGQLNATEEGRKALQTALGFRNTAQLESIESLVTPPSTSEVIAKARQIAAGLLEAGRRSWKMPAAIAPLTLEEHEPHPVDEPRRRTIAEVASALGEGKNLVLFGSGGIGKTTLLLELCRLCLTTEGRTALFIDAAVWARSNMSLLEYVARSAPAQVNTITANELADLAESGKLIIMLNGWNEIPAASKLSCREHLLQLTTVAPKLVVSVASRTATDVPSLDHAKHVEVLGLTWRGQAEFIRGELDGNQAAGLLDLLVRDTRLRHAGRSPLILRGLIAQAKEGRVAGSSVFDLLGAAVRAFEGDDQRNLMLSEPPVDGHHRVYLEELACELTQRVLTACSREEALRCMQSAGRALMERGVIGTPPSPNAVLTILVSHHLLHLDDDTVRFAHQRFQEYFAATRLVRAFDKDDIPRPTLRATLNLAAWEGSLLLAAGELKGRLTPSEARARFVRVLSELDLGLACDVAGACRFSESDDRQLHNSLIERVNQLANSNLEQVRDVGIAYQIASRFSEFSENLWALLETDDRQARLHVYRLGGIAMSLSQLGLGAKGRVAAWSPEHRVEFVHEIARDADNYEFLVELATTEANLEVRVAAISALFWQFPASDAALVAWLNAPVDAQLDDRLLNEVAYALEEGIAGEKVRDRIRGLINDTKSPEKQSSLALAFPEEIGARGVDLVFNQLRGSERRGSYAPRVAIAREKDPKRLESLVQKLALGPGLLQEWVREYLEAAPKDFRTELFEKAWLSWQKNGTLSGTLEQLGFLANQAQIDQIITHLVSLSGKSRPLSHQDGENQRMYERLLTDAVGDDLLAAVMGRAEEADYETACRLVELVYRRTGADTGSRREGGWLPTASQVWQLIGAFEAKQESAQVPQIELKVLLCRIASLVVPAEIETLLLATTRSYLDSWLKFSEVIEEWSNNPSSPRPQNPYWGTTLGSAWVRTGFSYLRQLLELLQHPEAKVFVPELVPRIVNIQWEARFAQGPFRAIASDIEEGKRRRTAGRVLMQPDDAQQSVTDEAARAIGKMLEDLVSDCMKAKAEDAKWNAKPAAHWMRRLAVALASVPSPLVVPPVSGALASGLMDVFGTVASIRALVRQGVVISDASIVRAIEATYDREGQAQWLDNQTRHVMSELTQLVFCVSPATFLSRPLEYYAKQWHRFEHPNHYVHLLGATPPENAWPVLLQIGLDARDSRNLDEQLAAALLSAVTREKLPEFLALVANRTFFRWYHTDWSFHRPPNELAKILEETGQVPAFLEACRTAGLGLSDLLACRVVSQIKGCDDSLKTYLLDALDAGRALTSDSSSYRLIKEMFTTSTDIGDGRREISPKAQNELRAALYLRAKGTGDVGDGCKRLLAELECESRESGRSEDELRHPVLDDGMAWTDIFILGRA